MFCTETALT